MIPRPTLAQKHTHLGLISWTHMKTVIVLVSCLLSTLPAMPQANSPTKPHPTEIPSTTSTSSAPADSQSTAAPSDDEKIRELTHRVQKLELEAIQQAGQQTSGTTTAIITAIIGAVAVLCVALIGIVAQYFAAKHQDRGAVAAAARAADLAKLEAVYRSTEKILEFRLRQMEQFYAPMFALLGQSEGLYNKMRNQLVQDDPKRYRWVPDADPKDGKVQILDKDGKWKGFRLLDQFPVVRTNPKALALADRVLEIGKQITGIITKHAGLASEDLLDVLGKYLAHYAILSAVRQDDRTEPYPPGSHEIGYYPRELNLKIEAGYREVATFIADYTRESRRLLEHLPLPEAGQRS